MALDPVPDIDGMTYPFPLSFTGGDYHSAIPTLSPGRTRQETKANMI